jgi:PIN domain nuclease of toxin-antitoxin system
MKMSVRAVLLDTCAVIWLANGELASDVVAVIVAAELADGIYVSPISAWEIGILAKPKAGRSSGLQFLPDPKTWFGRLMSAPGIKVAPFSGDIAIDASNFPEPFHSNPAIG